MKKPARTLISSGLLTVGIAVVLTVACRDTAEAPTAALPRDASAAIDGLSARLYSRTELHARNQLDWVGQAHNRFIALALQELGTPGTRVTDLCRRMALVVAEPRNWDGVLAGRIGSSDVGALQAGLRESALCNEARRREFGPPRRSGAKLASFAQEGEPSPQAMAIYDDIVAATEQATDPDDLANRLSPISDQAATLQEIDSLFVYSGVAVALGSGEYWYDGSAFGSIYAQVKAELDLCMSGQSEGATFESEGNSYLCQNSEWRMVALPGPRAPRAMIQLASWSPPQWENHCAIRWDWVVGWDAKAAKSVIALAVVLRTKTIPTLIGGAVGTSLAAAFYEAFRSYICNHMW